MFAFVGDSTMTSGLPPGTAVFRRAGAFGPPAVASVLSLPVWLVFVGTVLLSVVLRWCRVCVRSSSGTSAARIAPRRATVSHAPDTAPGTTLRGRAVTGHNVGRSVVFPGPAGRVRGLTGASGPVTTCPTAARVGKSGSR